MVVIIFMLGIFLAIGVLEVSCGFQNRQVQLREAAKAGDADQIRDLLQTGELDVDWREDDDEDCIITTSCVRFATPLIHALHRNPINVGATARILIENGANVNAKEAANRWTPLMFASLNGRVEIIHYLLDRRNVDVNAKSNEGSTALMVAAEMGQTETVRLLLGRGADINATNVIGWSALTFSANSSRLEVINLFLNRGANIEGKTMFDGYTALILAAEYGRLEVVRLLLDRSANIAARGTSGATALMLAAEGGQLETVRFLLDRGADINARDFNGDKPLLWAARAGQRDVVRLLLTRGASRDGCDASKWSFCSNIIVDLERQLVHVAASGNVSEVRELLVLHLIDPDWRHETSFGCPDGNNNGFVLRNVTALIAASHCSPGDLSDISRHLLDNGASVNASESAYGFTALMRASARGELETVQLLLDRSADINARSISGETALMAATRNGEDDVVDLLLNRGASRGD